MRDVIFREDQTNLNFYIPNFERSVQKIKYGVVNTMKMSITQYLNASRVKEMSLEGKPLTIVGVQLEKLPDQKEKHVIYVLETELGYIPNATNMAILIEALGDESDKWLNKKITLSLIKITFNEKLVDSIQVSIPDEKVKA